MVRRRGKIEGGRERKREGEEKRGGEGEGEGEGGREGEREREREEGVIRKPREGNLAGECHGT